MSNEVVVENDHFIEEQGILSAIQFSEKHWARLQCEDSLTMSLTDGLDDRLYLAFR